MHNTETKITGEQRDKNAASIMAEKDFDGELIWAARPVVIKPFSKASLFLKTNAKGSLQLDPFTKLEQWNPCKIARDVTDVYL